MTDEVPVLFGKIKGETEKRNSMKESMQKDNKVTAMTFNRDIAMLRTQINDMKYIDTKIMLLDQRIDTV